MILKDKDFDYLSYIEYGNDIDLPDLWEAKIESINQLNEYHKRKKVLSKLPEIGFLEAVKLENDFAYKFWSTNVSYQIYRKISNELPGFTNPLKENQCKPNDSYVTLLNNLLRLDNEKIFIIDIIEYKGKLITVYSDKTIYDEENIFKNIDLYTWDINYLKIFNNVFQVLRVDQNFNINKKCISNPNGAKIYLNFNDERLPLSYDEYFTILIISDKIPIKIVQTNLLGYIREVKDFSCLSKSKEIKQYEEIKRERIREKHKFNK